MPSTKTIASNPVVGLWVALVSILIEDGESPPVAIATAHKMIARFARLRQTGEKETVRLGV